MVFTIGFPGSAELLPLGWHQRRAVAARVIAEQRMPVVQEHWRYHDEYHDRSAQAAFQIVLLELPALFVHLLPALAVPSINDDRAFCCRCVRC